MKSLAAIATLSIVLLSGCATPIFTVSGMGLQALLIQQASRMKQACSG